MPKTKALVLMSGGLDSMLAARTLKEQGVEVTGLVFISNFFGAKKAQKAASQIGVELKEVEFKKEHLDMVKSPKHGYGKNMNPCIDCHTLMLKHAKKIKEEEVYDFVATGEVLGQRPMSQNKEALDIVARESGLGDLLVRPMSAKLLEETRPEKEKKIIRGKLYSIKGRSRNRQMELVEKYGIKEYAPPGGGCLLTDPGFSERMIKMFDYWPDCTDVDIELLKNGRVFWINGKNGKIIIVVGRHKEENDELEKIAQKGDIIMELKDKMGPTTLIRIKSRSSQGEFGIPTHTSGNYELRVMDNPLRLSESEASELEIEVPNELKMSELKLGDEKSNDEILSIASLLTGYYAKKLREKKVKIKVNII